MFKLSEKYPNHSDLGKINPKKILVIQVIEIGDVLVTTSICKTLKLNYPNAKIDYMVMDYCASVVDGNPDISDIIKVSKEKSHQLLYLLHFAYQIRRKKYDLLIDFQANLIGSLTSLVSGCKIRLGFDSKLWQLTHTITVPFKMYSDDRGNGAIVDDRFTALKPLNLKKEDRTYSIYTNNEEKQLVKEKLINQGINLNKPKVVLGVTSKGDYKLWNIESYIEIAEWLVKEYNAQIIVSGAPHEQRYFSQIKESVGEQYKNNIFDNFILTIRQYAIAISFCDLHIGTDSAQRHIAQSFNIPSVCIFPAGGEKFSAIPTPKNDGTDRFIGLDAGDALGLTNQQWMAIKPKRYSENETVWDEILSADFVIKKIKQFITEHQIM